MLKKVQALGLQLADLVTADEAAWAGKPEELVLLDLLLLQLLDVDHDQEVSLEELKAFQVGRLGGWSVCEVQLRLVPGASTMEAGLCGQYK